MDLARRDDEEAATTDLLATQAIDLLWPEGQESSSTD